MARRRRSEERHGEIRRILEPATGPLMGSELAKRFGVSRQGLVLDVAILRAQGKDIIATPHGYVLPTVDPTPATQRDVLRVQQGRDAIFSERSILVDLGITIFDVTVEHPVLGSLRGDVRIASRHETRQCSEALERTGSLAVLELVGDHRHSHAVAAPRPDLLEKAREEFGRRSVLAEERAV